MTASTRLSVPLSAWPAMVLTAGLGTRLAPLSELRAKPALPVAGTPLAGRILRRYRGRVCLNCPCLSGPGVETDRAGHSQRGEDQQNDLSESRHQSNPGQTPAAGAHYRIEAARTQARESGQGFLVQRLTL